MNNPRMPKSLLRQALTKHPEIRSDELFEQIHQLNRIFLIKIINELNCSSGHVPGQIRDACLDHIEILGKHFGAVQREIIG